MFNTRKFLIPLLLLCGLVATVSAENVLKTARQSIKNSKDLDKTATTLIAEAQKAETKTATKVKCYMMAADCSRKLYEAENTKLYLKQAYDTVKLFSNIADMIDRIYIADSIECDGHQTPESSNARHHRQLAQRIDHFRPNLLIGGRWAFSRGRHQEAYRYLDMYNSMASHPIFQHYTAIAADTARVEVAYLATVSAHLIGNTEGVLRYAELGQASSFPGATIQEYAALAHLKQGDSTAWVQDLRKGLSRYSAHPYFFINYCDWLDDHGRYEESIALADSMIAVCDTVALYWYAKSLTLLQMGRDREVIDVCDSCLLRDSTHVEAYYNKGIASLNLAMKYYEALDIAHDGAAQRRGREVVRSMYNLARQPMERVRQLAPNEPQRWAPSLYRIYLNLNMGKEFEEIERILGEGQPAATPATTAAQDTKKEQPKDGKAKTGTKKK